MANEAASSLNEAATRGMEKLLNRNEVATKFYWSPSEANEAYLIFIWKNEVLCITNFETASR